MRVLIIPMSGPSREEERTPQCGEDFCQTCGDCLDCHGGDPCFDFAIGESRGEHTWIIEETV